jgi:hypothetical protein
MSNLRTKSVNPLTDPTSNKRKLYRQTIINDSSEDEEDQVIYCLVQFHTDESEPIEIAVAKKNLIKFTNNSDKTGKMKWKNKFYGVNILKQGNKAAMDAKCKRWMDAKSIETAEESEFNEQSQRKKKPKPQSKI